MHTPCTRDSKPAECALFDFENVEEEHWVSLPLPVVVVEMCKYSAGLAGAGPDVAAK